MEDYLDWKILIHQEVVCKWMIHNRIYNQSRRGYVDLPIWLLSIGCEDRQRISLLLQVRKCNLQPRSFIENLNCSNEGSSLARDMAKFYSNESWSHCTNRNRMGKHSMVSHFLKKGMYSYQYIRNSEVVGFYLFPQEIS